MFGDWSSNNRKCGKDDKSAQAQRGRWCDVPAQGDGRDGPVASLSLCLGATPCGQSSSRQNNAPVGRDSMCCMSASIAALPMKQDLQSVHAFAGQHVDCWLSWPVSRRSLAS